MKSWTSGAGRDRLRGEVTKTEGRGVARSLSAVAANGPLLRLQAAYGLFTIYEMGLWVVILLWAYSAGGAPLAGLVAVLQLVPAAVLAPVGGRLADRLPYDVALRAGYLAQGATMGLLAVVFAVHAPTAVGVAAAVASCVVIAWTRPAHYAAAVELASSPGEAAAANSLSGTMESAGYFVGPLLAGIGAAVGGPTLGAAVCAVAACAAAALLTGLRLGRPQPASGDVRGADAGAAPRVLPALARRPALAALLLVVGAVFLVEGALELLAVAFAHTVLGRGQAAAGLLLAAAGLGGVLGAAGAVLLARVRRLWLAVCGGLVLMGAPLTASTTTAAGTARTTLITVSGMAAAFLSVAGITLMERAVPDVLLGRILGLRESAMLAGLAAGAAVTPALLRAVGPAHGYAVVGVGLWVLAVAAIPALLSLDAAGVHRPELVALLRGVDFLALLEVSSVERLAHSAVRTEVEAGAAVVVQGEPGDAYYVVETGQLLVSVAGQDTRVVLGAGDGFGEIALLRAVPRTATVTAITACLLWRVDRDLFLATVAGSAGHDVAQRQVDAQLRRLSA